KIKEGIGCGSILQLVQTREMIPERRFEGVSEKMLYRKVFGEVRTAGLARTGSVVQVSSALRYLDLFVGLCRSIMLLLFDDLRGEVCLGDGKLVFEEALVNRSELPNAQAAKINRSRPLGGVVN